MFIGTIFGVILSMILLIVVIPQLLGLHFLDEMGSISFLSAIVITAGSDYVYVIEKRPDFLIAGEFSPFGKSEGYGTEYQTRDAGGRSVIDGWRLFFFAVC